MLSEIHTKLTITNEEDYRRAVVNLTRLDETHQLRPSDIRRGKISEKFRSPKLNG